VALLVDLDRRVARGVIEREIRAELAIEVRDPRDEVVDDAHRLELARRDLRRRLRDRQPLGAHSPPPEMIAGTTNKSSSLAGAPFNASAGSSDGSTLSRRRRRSIGTACVIAGTPSVSTVASSMK